MTAYIARRLLEVIPTVLLVLTLVFLALRVLPGDPAVAALGEFATPDAIESFRHKLGLDQPLWVQYVSFLRQALTGDFGQSMTNGTSINALLVRSLPYTMQLAAAALLFGMVIGVPLGVWTATRRGGSSDSGCDPGVELIAAEAKSLAAGLFPAGDRAGLGQLVESVGGEPEVSLCFGQGQPLRGLNGSRVVGELELLDDSAGELSCESPEQPANLFDGVFLAAVIEDEGGAVVAFGGFHFGSLRLSWFMAVSAPRESSSSRPER